MEFAWIMASVLLSILGMEMSAAGQMKTNEQNQQNMMAQWEREDTTLQRSRADAEAAGFSPLAGLAGQAGAGQLTTLQNPMSAFEGLGSAFNNSVATGDTVATGKKQRALTESQTRYQNLLNDQQKLDNTFQLTRILKELDGIDLHNDNLKAELMAKLGEQIATGVISPEDTSKIASEFNSINKDFLPRENKYIEKDYNVRKQQADTAQSNVSLGWTREKNRAEEAQREFESSNQTKETSNKMSFSYGGITYEFESKDITSGKIMPASIGLDPKVKPLGSYGGVDEIYFTQNSTTGKYWTDLKYGNNKSLYATYEGISDAGLPCVSADGLFGRKYYVITPSKYGYTIYPIDSKQIKFGFDLDKSMGLFSEIWKKMKE